MQSPMSTAKRGSIGMSPSEKGNFRFSRLVHALANPGDKGAQERAAFELEVSSAAATMSGRAQRGPGSATVPLEVLQATPHAERALTVGTATAGGNTVQTDVLEQNFVNLLRNRMMVQRLGATVLTDLLGPIALPRQTGGATAYWFAEAGTPTESDQTFDQVTLSPKTVGAYTDFSRRLMLQSSMDIEAFVRLDLATTIALEIDRVAINGSGSSNQPKGILNTSGIGSVAGGTNGAAPTLANIIALESAAANANADIGALAYLTNGKVRGKLKQTDKTAGGFGQFVWGDAPAAPGLGDINGYLAGVTNQVPSNLTKGTSSGVCSAILFGNWNDLLIGMWGGLDILVDPYSNSTSGTVRVVVFQDCDIAVRQAASFAAMLDALTT